MVNMKKKKNNLLNLTKWLLFVILPGLDYYTTYEKFQDVNWKQQRKNEISKIYLAHE